MMFLRTLAWGFLWCIGALALLHFLQEDEPVYLVEMPLVRAASAVHPCEPKGPPVLRSPEHPADRRLGQPFNDKGTA